MSLGFRKIFAVLTLSLSAISMPAQDIPVLPDDPSVLKGLLPDGMAYYVVSNKAVAGTADFALVQKTGRLTASDSSGVSYADEVIKASRDALSYLPRFGGKSPQDFLLRRGVAPEKDGYVKVTDDATVFRAGNVVLEDGTAVLDSMILMIMDIADRANRTEDEFISGWYTPSDQAVIVSGDIDAKAVVEKIRSMSFMIPYREPLPRPDYTGARNAGAVFVADTSDSPFSDISFTWVSQRPPKEYMNTVQPAVFEKTVSTLGRIAVRRLNKQLRDKGIPVAYAGYGLVSSETSPYDDAFTLDVTVGRKDAETAFETAVEVLSSLDSYGAGIDEYLLAEAEFFESLDKDIEDKSNAGYLDRCINAFLNNASLASPQTKMDFHKSRNISGSMRLKLFNDVAMALLDSSSNLTVRYQGDSIPLAGTFGSVWKKAALAGPASSDLNLADTLGFPGRQAKEKVKSVKKEHVSGGSIWQFANGFKVIYKKMPADRMYYTLAFNRGYNAVKGLEPGEGAFMSDYFRTCHVAGLKGDTFKELLTMEGIAMDVNVGVSNTMISGHAPADRLHLLLRSLLAVANSRTRDEKAFRHYKDSEYLALEHDSGGLMARMTAIDSIMCPDYRYSPYKTVGKISDGFPDKADTFFDELFSNTSDGALVLVGNMDEEKLKRLLMEYVGGFRTMDVAYRRPVVRYQPVSGWSTYTVDGDRNCIDVAVSARMPVTAENYIAAHLAAEVLEHRLAEALGGSGMHMTVTGNCRIYPEERLNLMISVSEASADGFVSGMELETPISVLDRIRAVLSGLHQIEISESALKMCKARLKNGISIEMKDPRYWVDAIVLRYLDGKDLSTDYASRVDAVTEEKVKSVLNMLDDGCKIEYVTTRKY